MSIKRESILTDPSLDFVCHMFFLTLLLRLAGAEADNLLPSVARDPLIYSFIKSVNEKTDKRCDSVIRKNSQHG